MPVRKPALRDHLRALIEREGPIPVARYMAEALGHQELGYYSTRDPFGTAGDFITAPEVSQVFGELIGLWSAVVWQQLGRPAPIRVVELGPGRGTLMADALRATARSAPDFRDAAEIHLVETSPVLRARQESVLVDAGARWHDSFRSVPQGPFILVANEFFDALPVLQFLRGPDGWKERLVDTDGRGGFRFVLSDDRTAPVMEDIPTGSVVEVCPEGLTLARRIASCIARSGGAALIIDYGYAASAPGETLQAVRGHESIGVLTEPGEADLTAHVDFAALSRVALRSGAAVYGPLPQGEFLTRLGIRERTETLAAGATPAQADALRSGCRRLIDAAEMGTLFKALALVRIGQPAPPAFDESP